MRMIGPGFRQGVVKVVSGERNRVRGCVCLRRGEEDDDVVVCEQGEMGK